MKGPYIVFRGKLSIEDPTAGRVHVTVSSLPHAMWLFATTPRDQSPAVFCSDGRLRISDLVVADYSSHGQREYGDTPVSNLARIILHDLDLVVSSHNRLMESE